jgi:thymidylate synthase (FAD)
MSVELLAITPDAEALIERAGRICYASEPKGDPGAFIRRRLAEGHESIIEHASATVLVECSRACSHQLVRHRLASYSQESQRYVDAANFDYVTPPSIDENTRGRYERRTIWQNAMDDAAVSYERLRELGVPKEDARFVLPNACLTRLVVTMNFRSWRHFIRIRGDKTAQWEIRDVAREVLAILQLEAPSVFGDLEVSE